MLRLFFAPAERPRPVGRLTRDQLEAISADLLGVVLGPVDLAVLPSGGGVDELVSSSKFAEGVWSWAGHVADRAIAPGGKLAGFCAGKGLSGRACARSLVEEVGPLLFLRRLTTAEVDRFSGYFTEAEGLPEAEALALILKALLVSPYFLYPAERLPAGAGQDHYRLGRLTLALWDSLPDAATVARHAADARAGRLSPVEALLADRRSDRFVRKLGQRFADVTRLGDLQKADPFAQKFGAAVQAALRAEIDRVLRDVVEGKGDTFTQLLTSPRVWVNRDSAHLYGLESASPEIEPLSARPEERRAGLLTNAALLAIEATNTEGSAVKRGVVVLDRLLCAPPPPPPEDVPLLESIKGDDLTQRERLAVHSRPGSACVACHRSIDGIGLGLENYDAIGRFVATDHGKPLTGEGVVPPLMGTGEQRYRGAAELGAILARAAQARECFVRQLHLAVTGRDSRPGERADLESARERFVASGNVRGLLTDLLTSDSTSVRF